MTYEIGFDIGRLHSALVMKWGETKETFIFHITVEDEDSKAQYQMMSHYDETFTKEQSIGYVTCDPFVLDRICHNYSKQEGRKYIENHDCQQWTKEVIEILAHDSVIFRKQPEHNASELFLVYMNDECKAVMEYRSFSCCIL